jgi:hypothetical protein
MRKIFLLLALLVPTLAFGQSTTVSGTVIDTDAQQWTSGTVVASFVPAPGTNLGQYTWTGGAFNPGVSITISITAGGNYTQSIPSNTAIVPSGSKWTFTANSGTTSLNTQSSTVTVTGGTQTVNFVPAGIRITAGPGAVAYADIEVAAGVGGSYFSLTTSSLRNCTAATGAVCTTWAAAGGASTFSGGSVIDATAAPYNLKVGFFVTDATVTNGQNTISCPNNDCFFTTAMNGWLTYATNMTSDASTLSSIVVLPTGGGATCTFTFVSAQSGTCSANSSASIAGAAVLVMVPADQSAGMIAALAAAAKAGTSVQWPDGVIGTTVCVPDPVATGKLLGNGVATSVGQHGWGKTHSIIAPLPGVPGAGATGGDGKACFGGGAGWTYHDYEYSWFGQSAIGASFNGKVGFEVDGSAALGNSSATNIYIMSGGANTAGFIGFQVSRVSSAYITGVFVDGGGSTNCNIVPGTTPGNFAELFNLVCGNASVTALAASNGTIDSFGGIYGDNLSTATGPGTLISGSVDFHSDGDVFDYTNNASLAQVQVTGASAVAWFNNDRIHAPNTTTLNGLRCDSSAVCYVSNSRVISDNGSAVIALTSGSITNVGGNIIAGNVASVNCQGTYNDGQPTSLTVGSTAAFFLNASCTYNAFFPTLSGVCTGVATASQTLGLYDTGPNVTATTCTSTNIGTGIAMKRAGTAYALKGTATAAGTAAGSGVMTVLKNGAGTAITCTYGTTTACTDIAHNFTFVAGDRLSIQFTTQAAETLAGVNAQVVVE